MPANYEKPIVAIVGRANVGKSSLFNRLLGSTQAIVTATAGTTRDRLYGTIAWNTHEFILVDTAGLDLEHDDPFAQDIAEQVALATAEASLILFMVDGRDGVMPQDTKIARWLRRKNAPRVLLVVNKIDKPGDQSELLLPFYDFGFEGPLPVSALSGKQTGDLLDAVVAKLPKKLLPAREEILTAALIGKPNVGKSSLFNALVGSNRAVVADEPGTTRDMVAEDITTKHGTLRLLDTAGMRRRTKVKVQIEKLSVLQSLRAIDRAQVVLFVVSSLEQISHNELQMANYVAESGKPMIVLANKADELSEEEQAAVAARLSYRIQLLEWSPLLFVSAKEKQNLSQLISMIFTVAKNTARKLSAEQLKDITSIITARHKPAKRKGSKNPKLLDLRQTGTNPPRFTITIDMHMGVTKTYSRFLERMLRELDDFTGTPIVLQYKTPPKE